MPEILTHVCDGITGARIDTVPAEAFAYSRLLSAGDSGSKALIPLDGSFGKAALKALLQPWRYMLALERDGALDYSGYIVGRPYSKGPSRVGVELADLWALLGNRLAVDHSFPQAVLWSQAVTGSRAAHANQAFIWARDSYTGSPDASFPLTIPAPSGGASISRTYYGYHLTPVPDFLKDLMDEGLDIYLRPEWSSPGVAGWWAHAADAWSSGLTRDFSVTAEGSEVTEFSETVDGRRMLNNSIRVGEGSEVDMLAISNLDTGSPLPLLERVSQSKTATTASQLSIMAGQDLVTFGTPTVQWDFKVAADTVIDVGDLVRMHFDGDPWMDDGYFTRRVVKISGDLSDKKTVGVQPTGGG